MKKNVFFWGAKFKAGIIYNLIKKKLILKDCINLDIKYLFDPGLNKPKFSTKAYFSNKKKDLKKFINNSDFFVVCIGNHYGMARYLISKKLEKQLRPLQIISKHSYIADRNLISRGVQIFPKSIVQENSTIGEYTILNTASLVEHDCIIDDHSHISTGVILNGEVKVGKNTFIGSGTIVKNGIRIGDNCIITMGSIIKKNIPNNTKILK